MPFIIRRLPFRLALEGGKKAKEETEERFFPPAGGVAGRDAVLTRRVSPGLYFADGMGGRNALPAMRRKNSGRLAYLCLCYGKRAGSSTGEGCGLALMFANDATRHAVRQTCVSAARTFCQPVRISYAASRALPTACFNLCGV